MTTVQSSLLPGNVTIPGSRTAPRKTFHKRWRCFIGGRSESVVLVEDAASKGAVPCPRPTSITRKRKRFTKKSEKGVRCSPLYKDWSIEVYGLGNFVNYLQIWFWNNFLFSTPPRPETVVSPRKRFLREMERERTPSASSSPTSDRPGSSDDGSSNSAQKRYFDYCKNSKTFYYKMPEVS